MKRRNIICFAIVFIIIILIATISNATDITVQKLVPSTDGSITFNFSNLELEEEQDYQWAIEKSKTAKIENWYDIMNPNYKKGEVQINVNATNKNQLAVLKSTDTAYITIRKAGETTNLLEAYEVDLTLPLLKAFNTKDSGLGGIELRTVYGISSKNIKCYWEKITDAEVINNYIDSNHDLSRLKLKNIESFPSLSNTNWKLPSFRSETITSIYASDKPKEDGLYYLWLMANDTNAKTIKGYAICEIGEVKKITNSTNKEPEASGENTSNVDKTTKPTTTPTSSSGKTATTTDATTSKKQIPFAGKGVALVVSILVILIIGYISRTKYNSYKDIK